MSTLNFTYVGQKNVYFQLHPALGFNFASFTGEDTMPPNLGGINDTEWMDWGVFSTADKNNIYFSFAFLNSSGTISDLLIIEVTPYVINYYGTSPYIGPNNYPSGLSLVGLNVGICLLPNKDYACVNYLSGNEFSTIVGNLNNSTLIKSWNNNTSNYFLLNNFTISEQAIATFNGLWQPNVKGGNILRAPTYPGGYVGVVGYYADNKPHYTIAFNNGEFFGLESPDFVNYGSDGIVLANGLNYANNVLSGGNNFLQAEVSDGEYLVLEYLDSPFEIDTFKSINNQYFLTTGYALYDFENFLQYQINIELASNLKISDDFGDTYFAFVNTPMAFPGGNVTEGVGPGGVYRGIGIALPGPQSRASFANNNIRPVRNMTPSGSRNFRYNDFPQISWKVTE